MKIFKNITDMIGSTPLMELSNIEQDNTPLQLYLQSLSTLTQQALPKTELQKQ